MHSLCYSSPNKPHCSIPWQRNFWVLRFPKTSGQRRDHPRINVEHFPSNAFQCKKSALFVLLLGLFSFSFQPGESRESLLLCIAHGLTAILSSELLKECWKKHVFVAEMSLNQRIPHHPIVLLLGGVWLHSHSLPLRQGRARGVHPIIP